MKTDEDKLTLWALAKSRNLKSFVQIVYPGQFPNYLMCETKEAAKSIDPPEFGEDPQCLNSTVEVDRP